MEMISVCFALASALVLWFIAPIIVATTRLKSKQLPPGPRSLPIVGSLHRVMGTFPHRRLMDLSRRHGPLMFLMLGEVPAVVVSSAEGAEAVMRTNDLAFATRPRSTTLDIVSRGRKGVIFTPYGDHWRQMRKICVVELFSARQVRRMESVWAHEVARLVRSFAGSGSGEVVNFSETMYAFMNDLIARAVFGGTCEQAQQAEYLREFSRAIELAGGFLLVDLFPSSRLLRRFTTGVRQLTWSFGRIQHIIGEIITARRALRAHDRAAAAGDQDLLDVLLNLQEEGSLPIPLTAEIIGVVISDIFGAGSGTSASAMEWAMAELLKNPEIMAKAQLEVRQVLGPNRDIITNNDIGQLHYMRLVIKEILRLHTITPLHGPREAREDCEIMGYVIPKGTKIIVNTFAISRDPKYWDNPEAFNPDRFENNQLDYKGANFEYTPFGAGRRQCPGILFGTSTMEVTLANLLYHFDWVLPDGTTPNSMDMTEKFGLTMGKMSDLQLRAIPYAFSKAT
ncbi:hypothetical protein QYE76_010269 [Lolium multiflorum]|uniref:Cytochrome P450 n=1 Tax=Lolium multiflorum TaxID=4521 RepID=A0AAD8X464_LOLMU|nr:hypothetical protein QYE76_010269 [Lolium multiflorum]